MIPIGHTAPNVTWEDWAKAHPEIVKRERKIILRNGQSPGDLLTLTRSIADLKECYPNYQIDVRTPCSEIWENSPRLTRLNEGDEGVKVFDIAYDEINISGWAGLHFSDAWRHDIEKKLDVPIKKTGIRPELWISDEEKSWYNQVHCEFMWDGPYWVGNFGRKQDNELKQYHRWQEVVDLFNERFKGRVKIVQIGHANHIHPELKGVLNLIGKTTTRELIRLQHWAHGSIGPISLQFVISAAFGQPAVVVAAGKEGPRWHEYNWIRWITHVGTLECARWDGCWQGGDVKGKCKNLVKINGEEVPKCFEMIRPYQIVDAIESYYQGGVLKLPTDEEYNKLQRTFEDFQKTQK